MTNAEVLSALDELIQTRSILQHRFYRAWQEGTLTRADLATYAKVYYPHVAAFPDYLRNTIATTTDDTIRTELENNLADELSNPAPHPELWIDFARAMGAADVSRTSAANTTATFHDLTKRGTAEGLAALYAYESQQPAVASKKLRGLREHYQVNEKMALAYFEVHAAADLAHRAGERASLARCLDAGASPDIIMGAAGAALDAYWHLLDEVCETAGIQD